MVWLVLDILLVVILVCSVFAGYRQGLLGSILRLAGFFVAIAAAAVISDKVAPVVFDSYVYDFLISTLAEKIGSNPDIAELIESINNGFVGILIGIGIVSADSIVAKISSLTGADASVLSAGIVDEVLAEPITAIVRTILFVVIFVITFFIVKMLIRALMGVNKVPLLGPLNRLLGSVFGFAQGILIDLLAVKIIATVMNATTEGAMLIQNVAVPKTIAFAFLYNFKLF